LTLPAGLTAIGSYAFQSCSGLKELTFPAGLTSIGTSAFYNCSGLEELTLPAGLTSIGSAAFSNCSGLEELTLPAGLTSIGNDAFYRCSGLKELTFPAGLTSIGDYAFENCSGLDSVTNLSLTPQHIENSVFDGVNIENITLTVPDSAVASYKSANVWKDFGSSSSNGITGGGVLLSVKPSNAALGSVSGALLSGGLYPAGTVVSVTAAPASGYSFWGWTSGGATLSASATLSFTLTQDTVITASFGKTDSCILAKAGTLKDMSGIESVTHLTLTGLIDARDVKFMRDAMPFLTELDLSGVIVVAYEGEGGTSPQGYQSYPANEMPQYAFYNGSNGIAKAFLTSVKLPAGLTSIGERAFYSCRGLTAVTNLSLTPQDITNRNVFYNVSVGSVTLRVSAASLEAYKSAPVWKDFYLSGGATLRARVNNSEWGAVAGAAVGWWATGATVSLAATPAQGYEFDSWTSGGETLAASASLSFTIAQDTVITANFKPTGNVDVYTVTFVANGGSGVDPIAVAAGDRIAKPADPALGGYTFDGWYGNAELTGSAWSFETGTVTADTALYARWAKITCTVTFETGGGSSVEPLTVDPGAHIAKPANPTRTGYTFDGWYRDAALSGSEWNFAGDAVSASITLYAMWAPIIYIVSFSVDGESSVKQQQVAYGGKIAEPADPTTTRTGYTFGGWYSDAAFAGSAWDFAGDAVTATTTLYAGWAKIIYTATFETGDGSSVSPQPVAYGNKIDKPADPSRTGYGFDKWYKDEALTTAWDFAADTVTANTTLYAAWQIKRYAVTFVSNGGSSVGGQTIDSLGKVAEPDDPARTGYNFVGWYKDDETFEDKWDFDADKVTANTTLYAAWQIKRYTVTFVSNGGSNVDGQTIDSLGTVNEANAHSARVGYNFVGWYKDAALTAAWDFAADKVTADATLYAKWTEIVYTVTFETGDGSSVDPQPVAYGNKIVKPADDPTRDGYTFAGWFKDAAFTGAWNFTTDVVTADTTLYARWIDKGATTYAVTFISNGDTVSSQLVEENDKVAQLTPPNRVGYTFGGWYSDAAFAGSAWDFAGNVVTADTTLYARWTEIIYTVTFETGGGSSVSPQTVAHGGKIVKPADDPSRDGYIFAGWYSDAAFAGSAWDFAADKVTSDTTLYARWIGKDAAIYTVTFVSNGDTVSSQPVEENGKVAPFTPPTRDGYTFAGWYSDAAFAGSAWDFAGSVVTADTTLYARWIGKDAAIYTVTFISNGDTVSSQPVAQGDTVVKPADPTRTGYTFEGWYSDEAFAGSAWDFATNVVTSDATLYARWNALPPTGVKSQTLGVARVYPNPTSGTITVESDGAEVWLYSLSGVLLERTSGNRINLSGYPAGVYLLRTGSKAAKVVKQ
jgi:uncharacterized repeat protein (TIGR02543 family)